MIYVSQYVTFLKYNEIQNMMLGVWIITSVHISNDISHVFIYKLCLNIVYMTYLDVQNIPFLSPKLHILFMF